MSLSIMSFEARCKLYQQEVPAELRDGLEMLHDSMLAALKQATHGAERYASLGGVPLPEQPQDLRRHGDSKEQ